MDRNLKTFAVLMLSALFVRGDTTFYDAVKWDFGSSLTVMPGINVTFQPGSTVNATGATLVGFPGGTGSSSFLGLVDTPDVYAGQGGKFVAVKADVTGLEFVVAPTGGGGGGTVTNFSSGNLLPLFSTTVTSPTTVPALAFTLLSSAPHTFFGNETGSSAAPHFVQPNFTDLAGDFALTQTPSLAAGALVGRTSASAGDWQAITVGGGLSLTGTTLATAATVGNVLNVAVPAANQLAIWTDATHIKGVNGLAGGIGGQVLKKSTNADYEWEWAADISGSGGSSTFITLTDVPPSYLGAAGKFVAVNNTANGLEFVTAPTGGGGAVTSVFGRTGAVTAAVGDYSAFYQPLDSDLTSIAALTTTVFGRGFLSLADAASSRTYIGAGTSNFDGTWTSLTGKPTTLVGFGITDAQPLDADLTALAATSGTNTIYYRSAANTWSAVTVGSNMTFGSGTLNAANSNWDTAYTERKQWDGGATGLVAATGRTSLGLDIGTNVQAFDADLSSLAAASATNTIYYRSAANTWSPVTIGGNMTFSGGTLDATVGGNVTGPASATSLSFALYNGTTGKVIGSTTASGVVVSTAGVFGTIADNSANWNTAFSERNQWNGGATGLVAATGRTSLALDNVTNDAQTKAVVVPNTAPATGQILVGNGTAYVPRSMSGAGATITMSATGIVTIDAIVNASLANSSITVGNASAATALGGSVSADQITGATGLGYVKRTAANTYTATTTSIPNADLANSSINIAGNSTALGGSVSLDAITGLSGVAGMVKRSGANTFATAVAGTDYKAPVDSIKVVMFTAAGTATYSRPVGLVALYVEGVGGGGGGGGTVAPPLSNYVGGGGGGGGGYSAVYIATPAASYSYTVGAGGAAGAAGGTTSFGAVLTATGGGAGGVGQDTNTHKQASGGVGGVGTVGLASGGSDGQHGAPGVGGIGGSSHFGGTTQSAVADSAAIVNGNAGALFGGGGGGGASGAQSGTALGGVGGRGMIRVWEIY
jgi:hypothetical protein